MNTPQVEINRRNSPQIKRSFALLTAATSNAYGPAVNVGHGFAFAIFVKGTGATGTNRIIIEARNEANVWATWKDIAVATGNTTQLVEAISAVSAIRAKVTPYGGGSFDVTVDVLNVKAIEQGATPATIDWSNLTNKPATFTPAAHTHAASEITDSTAVGRTLLTAASSAAQRTALDVNSTAQSAALIAGFGPRGGIISTGASAVGVTQDNTGLAFGTGNLTIGAWVRLPDWTPGSGVTFAEKRAGNVGWQLRLAADGSPLLSLGTGSAINNYTATTPAVLADGAWAFVVVTMARAGNATFYINGAQLGTAVVISVLSAQTMTSTGVLYWMSNGSTHYAGTLGESWIISGLLTATQIADIYRAGSIAPFSASFTFFQWCDFGQGYGPIVKDRSGQNQPALMGTSGLTHAVPRNPPGVPARAPRVALVGDGSNGSFVRSTLGTQNPDTGEMTLWWDGVVPSNSDGNSRTLAALSSATTDSFGVARAFTLQHRTAEGFDVALQGATSGDVIRKNAVNLLPLLAGDRAVVVARRSSTGVSIFLGYRGDFFDVTNLFVESTAGSSPGWSGQIIGTYLHGLWRSSSLSSTHSLFDLRLANVAMTEAQLRTEYERGEPGPEWQAGTKTGLVTGNDSTFASDTGFWSKGANTTIPADGTVVLNGTASYIGKLGLLTIGQRYRATVVIGTWTSGSALRVAGAPAAINYGEVTKTNGATTVIDFQATGTDFYVTSYSFAASGTIDTVTLEPLGYTARLRTDLAAGLTALDGSSNKLDFLLSTTGVTTSPNGRRQIIRPGTLTFTSPGTLNLQMFGASVVDASKKWRIVSFSGTANGAANISLGNVSAGAQYVSAKAVTAADFDTTDAQFVTRLLSTANLWVKSDATVTLTDVMVILEQTN